MEKIGVYSTAVGNQELAGEGCIISILSLRGKTSSSLLEDRAYFEKLTSWGNQEFEVILRLCG